MSSEQLDEVFQRLNDIDSRSHTRQILNRLSMRVDALEEMNAFLIAELYNNGIPFDITDKHIKRFFKIPNSVEDKDVILPIILQSLKPYGLLDCLKCGAKVKDLPGYTKEECIWCGNPIGSKE